MGIFDGHRRIVDQDADCEREPAERHGIERMAEEVQHDDRRQDREGNRNHDDQGRSPRPEKQQDHQPGQPGCDRAFSDHARNR